MLRFIALITLILSCTACTRYYSHATKGPTEFYADSSSCAGLAGQAAGPYDPYAVTRNRVYEECLFGKGWAHAEPTAWKPSNEPIEQPYSRAILYQELLTHCRQYAPPSELHACIQAGLTAK